MIWLNAVVQGVLLGGLYALLAAGLSLMFGVMRIVNLAHGALALCSPRTSAWSSSEATGVSPFVAMLVVVPIMAGVGYRAPVGLFNRALSAGGLAPLLAPSASPWSDPAAPGAVHRRQPDSADRGPGIAQHPAVPEHLRSGASRCSPSSSACW